MQLDHKVPLYQIDMLQGSPTETAIIGRQIVKIAISRIIGMRMSRRI